MESRGSKQIVRRGPWLHDEEEGEEIFEGAAGLYSLKEAESRDGRKRRTVSLYAMPPETCEDGLQLRLGNYTVQKSA